MFRIRNGIFETNSSSNDYYYDDDRDDTPSVAWGHQLVRVIPEWKEDVKDSQIETILEKITSEDEFYNIILELFADDNITEIEVFDLDDYSICLSVEVYAHIEWEGGYSPATRYSPAEYPYWIPYDGPLAPSKKDAGSVTITKAKEKLMKLFKEKGYTEIIGIESLYGEDVDDYDID